MRLMVNTHPFCNSTPHRLCQIKTLAFSESFGPAYGRWWTPSWKEAWHSIHRLMDRQRSSNAPWYTCCEDIVGNILSCGMNIFHMCNIPTIKHCTHLRIVHHLRHVLATYQKTLLVWSLEGKMAPVDMMIGTKCNSSFNGSSWFTKQYRSSWRKVKPGTRLDMKNTELTINSKWATMCGSISTRIGWKEKGRSCDQSGMVNSSFWRRLETMPFVSICRYICRCTP